MLKAVTRQASLVDSQLATINSRNLQEGKAKVSVAYFFDHYATEQDMAVMVTEEDFENAERELVPSVSMKELEHYKRVRAQFEKPEEEKAGKWKGKDITDWQQQQQESRPRSNGKGKVKVVDRKGKGKEWGNWDADAGDDDSYDNGMRNGTAVDKGKGKAVDMSFRQGAEDDDDRLY